MGFAPFAPNSRRLRHRLVHFMLAVSFPSAERHDASGDAYWKLGEITCVDNFSHLDAEVILVGHPTARAEPINSVRISYCLVETVCTSGQLQWSLCHLSLCFCHRKQPGTINKNDLQISFVIFISTSNLGTCRHWSK